MIYMRVLTILTLFSELIMLQHGTHNIMRFVMKFSNLSSKYFIASDFPARNAVRGELCKDC